MVVAFVAAASHSKHSPLYISAINFVPKLSKTHRPGLIVNCVVDEDSPHAVKSVMFVTVAPPLCDDLVVPLTSLAPPLKILVDVLLAAKLISSDPILISPVVGKAAELVRGMSVTASLIPEASVVVAAPLTVPPLRRSYTIIV